MFCQSSVLLYNLMHLYAFIVRSAYHRHLMGILCMHIRMSSPKRLLKCLWFVGVHWILWNEFNFGSCLSSTNTKIFTWTLDWRLSVLWGEKMPVTWSAGKLNKIKRRSELNLSFLTFLDYASTLQGTGGMINYTLKIIFLYLLVRLLGSDEWRTAERAYRKFVYSTQLLSIRHKVKTWSWCFPVRNYWRYFMFSQWCCWDSRPHACDAVVLSGRFQTFWRWCVSKKRRWLLIARHSITSRRANAWNNCLAYFQGSTNVAGKYDDEWFVSCS